MPIPLAVPVAIGAGAIASNLWDNMTNRQAAKDAYNEISDQAAAVQAANQADINAYRGMLNSTYGRGAANYDAALENFLNSPVYQNKDFEFTGDIGEYYDPAANQRVAAAMGAIENAAATGGSRFSSQYLDAQAAKQQALASEEWSRAYDRLMNARQQQLNEWQANSSNQWNNYGANQDRLQAALNAYGNDRNALTQGLGEATMASMNNRLGGLQTQASITGALTNSQSGPGALSQILSPAASFMAGMYAGGNK
jgi:hypothetical protein